MTRSFYESVGSRFGILLLVALILIDTLSGGQLTPSSRAFQKPPVLSNTSLSSKAVKTYIVYSFVDSPSLDSENEKIRLHLGMILAPADVQEYGGYYTGVEFWCVKMNDMQRAALMSAFPRVIVTSKRGALHERPLLTYMKAQVFEDTQLFYHDDLQTSRNQNQNVSHPNQFLSEAIKEADVGLGLGAETIYQQDAPSDLKVVSWAPNVPLGKTKSYAYDPEGGGEAVVYIIENGIDGRNHVIT